MYLAQRLWGYLLYLRSTLQPMYRMLFQIVSADAFYDWKDPFLCRFRAPSYEFHPRSPFSLSRSGSLLTSLYIFSICFDIDLVARLTICLAFSSSSHKSRFDAIPELDATQFLSTRKESYTPSCIGSIGSPVMRLSPTTLPSDCSSWSAATKHTQLAC